jgi:hypothetical protein
MTVTILWSQQQGILGRLSTHEDSTSWNYWYISCGWNPFAYLAGQPLRNTRPRLTSPAMDDQAVYNDPGSDLLNDESHRGCAIVCSCDFVRNPTQTYKSLQKWHRKSFCFVLHYTIMLSNYSVNISCSKILHYITFIIYYKLFVLKACFNSKTQ